MDPIDRRRFLLATAGGAGGLLLHGCSTGSDRTARPTAGGEPSRTSTTLDGPVPRPTVRLPGGDLNTLPSPFSTIAGIGFQRMTLVYDTLLWPDSTGELLPWLAEEHERASDGLSYTFTLRRGVRWHDGKPFTSGDVAFTFDYFARQTIAPIVVGQPSNVTAVLAMDDRTVRFELERPAVTFLEYVAATVPIVPEHIWSGVDDAPAVAEVDALIGTGPYRLEEFDSAAGSYLFTANDEFFLGRPFVGRIEIPAVGDQLTALLSGEVDAAGASQLGIGPEVLNPIRDDDSLGVVEELAGFMTSLYWNADRGGALADVRFRHACAMAIDRDQLVELLLGGNGTAGNPGFLPPQHPFHTDVEQYDFDPAGANELLDAGGYERDGSGGLRQTPEGQPLRFSLLIPNTTPQLADLLLPAFGAIGVEVVVEAVILPRLFGEDYDLKVLLFPGPSGFSPNSDPDLLRLVYASSSASFHHPAGYTDQQFDAAADEQLVTTDVDARRELVATLQEVVADDLPLLPLFYYDLFLAYRKEVFDAWYFTPTGFAGPYNKQAFVTGRRQGLEIRPTT